MSGGQNEISANFLGLSCKVQEINFSQGLREEELFVYSEKSIIFAAEKF